MYMSVRVQHQFLAVVSGRLESVPLLCIASQVDLSRSSTMALSPGSLDESGAAVLAWAPGPPSGLASVSCWWSRLICSGDLVSSTVMGALGA